MTVLPTLFDPKVLPAALLFYKALSPTHFVFLGGKRTLDVLYKDNKWNCMEVCADGLVGFELAQADCAQDALLRAWAALSTSSSPAAARAEAPGSPVLSLSCVAGASA